jgi:hypothetical protein
MISIGRRLSMFAVAVAAMGAVTACTASSGPAGAGPASSAPASSAPAGGGDARQFCGVVQQQKAVIQGTAIAGLLTGGTPEAWKAYFDQTAAMNQQLVDAAPAEIKASVKTLQDGTLELQSTLAAANYDVSKVGAAKLVQQFQSPERTAASAALVAYVKTNCGIDLTVAGS